MQIGAQLYTVRDFCTSPEKVREAFLKVADIGYRFVQLHKYGDVEFPLLRQFADEAGISIVATFPNIKRTTEDTENLIREHQILGAKHLGLGILPPEARTNLSEFYAICDALEAAISKINAAGMRFCYHNHSLEFKKLEGKRIFDHLLERFTPQQMGIFLDTYWIQNAGGDVCAWIDRLKGRLDCVHLKDMDLAPDDWKSTVYAPIGTGNMCFPRILEALESANTQYALVEQDFCYDRDPFDCLKISFDYLHSLGYC